MIVGFIYDDVSSKDMGVKARLTSWQVSGTLRNYSAAIPGNMVWRTLEQIWMQGRSLFPALFFLNCVFQTWWNLGRDCSLAFSCERLKQLIFDDVPDRYFDGQIKRQSGL